MTWFLYCMAAVWLSSAITTVSRVGKPRKPVTNEDAVVAVLGGGAWGVLCILYAAGVWH